jgi:DNA-binding transcriptional LysR family regulator
VSPKQRLRYNWNDIVYFLEVARQKSLVRAAERLRVDHTTVSRRVRELERSLNTSLFSRGKSGFNLTETGMRLLQFAEGMEGHANSIAEAIAGAGEGEAGGAVRIASMEGRRLQQALSLGAGRTDHRLPHARPQSPRGGCLHQLLQAGRQAPFDQEAR